jgi:predicted tellurium resistance membrane protein TerC
MDTNLIGLLLLLVGLELVLGVDNVLVISIFVGRLNQKVRNKARVTGLAFAMVARIIMLVAVVSLTKLTTPVVSDFSVRDLILIAGGLFLIYKAVREIHGTIELTEEKEHLSGKSIKAGFSAVIFQIVLLDIVFSIDSVITAVGMTDNLHVIILSVILSFVGLLFYAKPVGEFIIRNPAIKILALAFLITIGVTIFIEGLHQHVPKAYIYLPMGFALVVELLQMRYEQNKKKME